MPDEVIDESDRTLRPRIEAEKLTREDTVNRAKTPQKLWKMA
jgi:hypothetical protein